MTKEIYVSWNDEDVLSIASKLTEQQVSDVLEYVDDNHDADVGINWEVLREAVIKLFGPDFIDEGGEE